MVILSAVLNKILFFLKSSGSFLVLTGDSGVGTAESAGGHLETSSWTCFGGGRAGTALWWSCSTGDWWGGSAKQTQLKPD